MGRSRTAEALQLAEDLDRELAAYAAAKHVTLSWSVAERRVIELAQDATDRLVELTEARAAAENDSMRLRLATEIRLSEQALARLLKMIDTQPKIEREESAVSRKARKAAQARWDKHRGTG